MQQHAINELANRTEWATALFTTLFNLELRHWYELIAQRQQVYLSFDGSH